MERTCCVASVLHCCIAALLHWWVAAQVCHEGAHDHARRHHDGDVRHLHPGAAVCIVGAYSPRAHSAVCVRLCLLFGGRGEAGPGAYAIPDVLGKQAVSTRASSVRMPTVFCGLGQSGVHVDCLCGRLHRAGAGRWAFGWLVLGGCWRVHRSPHHRLPVSPGRVSRCSGLPPVMEGDPSARALDPVTTSRWRCQERAPFQQCAPSPRLH